MKEKFALNNEDNQLCDHCGVLESAKRYDGSIPRDEAKRNYECCYKDIVYGTFCKEHCFVGKRIMEIRSKIDPVALGIF